MTTTQHQDTVMDRALAFDLSRPINRYAKKAGLSYTDAEDHFLELRRYLTLRSMNPSAGYGMRGPVDEAWHTFISYTKDYAAFCGHLGGGFIHHSPSETDEDRARSLRGYEKFLADYHTFFRQAPPAHIWPSVLSAIAHSSECGACE